jgi:hypothetical protein
MARLFAAAAAAVLFAAPTAHAEGSPETPAPARSGAALVALVTADPAASLARRVRAELQTLGVDVIVLHPPDEGSTSRGPLERAARSVGAIAAVRLVPSSEGKIEVWVADRVTGKAVVRELDGAESGASDAAVAVASVELLRASLMELHSGEPPRGDVPATDAVRSLALPAPPTLAAPRVPYLALGVAAGAELGVRGLGPSPDAAVSVWVRLAPRLGARFIGRTSLAPARESTASGTVEVRSLLAGATAVLAFADPAGAWVPSLSAGFGAARVAGSGAATPPFVGASESTWAAAPLAGADLAWTFVPGLRLRAETLGALALPPVHVRTPGGDAGWWGGPAVWVSLGLEVLWAP